ncbi:MAG: UBP-type zinc finger domain-containing protein [Chloroflexi bacterium]|nr:UBP-type zinc finger domain-containing protein [Chloroflexota bacterium]
MSTVPDWEAQMAAAARKAEELTRAANRRTVLAAAAAAERAYAEAVQRERAEYERTSVETQAVLREVEHLRIPSLLESVQNQVWGRGVVGFVNAQQILRYGGSTLTQRAYGYFLASFYPAFRHQERIGSTLVKEEFYTALYIVYYPIRQTQNVSGRPYVEIFETERSVLLHRPDPTYELSQPWRGGELPLRVLASGLREFLVADPDAPSLLELGIARLLNERKARGRLPRDLVAALAANLRRLEVEYGLVRCSDHRACGPKQARVCELCLDVDGTWSELVECLVCGHIACDRHRGLHAQQTGHAVARQIEREHRRPVAWDWCYTYAPSARNTLPASTPPPQRKGFLDRLLGR